MLEAGSHVGEYEVLRHVTNGAMSEVYQGRHVKRDDRVALKVLHPDLCLEKSMVGRFLNEARALESLRHEHIISLFASGFLDEGRPYMILEWLPFSLEHALGCAGGAVASDVAVSIAVQIGEAIGALHEQGIIHRDLKPANILLAAEGLADATVKLADLGLAKTAQGNALLPSIRVSTGKNEAMGTPEYMAPEQWIRAKDATDRADVYSMGVLLFQMIAGRLPFLAREPKEWMGLHLLQSPPLELLGEATPGWLREVITQMLAKKAPDRPSMSDVLKRLRAARSRGDATNTNPSARGRHTS